MPPEAAHRATRGPMIHGPGLRMSNGRLSFRGACTADARPHHGVGWPARRRSPCQEPGMSGTPDQRPGDELPTRDAPLREQARRVLRRWLIEGELKPGQDLNERMIGNRLGVSRTPVREALLLLTLEGFVSMSPYEGYYVAPLTRDEGEELFRLIAVMERVALVRGEPPTTEELTLLDSLDAQRIAARDHDESIELDREWHQILLPAERVGAVTREELTRLLNRLDRYERALTLDDPTRAELVSEHRVIVEAIRDGNLDEAGRLLEEHWLWHVRRGIPWPPEEAQRPD